MLTVYGTPRSRTSVVLWLLREMGKQYRHVDSPISGDKDPEHLEVNPEGTMPTIKDGDFVMTESMAITYYLAKKYGGDMGPRDLEEEAKILRWTTWAVADVDRHIVALVNASGVDEDHPYNEERYAEATALLQTPLRRFNEKLGDRDFLVGNRLTVADINVAFLLSFLLLLNYDMSELPNVARFMTAMTGRDSFRSILAPTEEHVADALPARACQ
ncbi:MAG: glutathione S-transferase family protein [Gammaproteobacteria bacterium]